MPNVKPEKQTHIFHMLTKPLCRLTYEGSQVVVAGWVFGVSDALFSFKHGEKQRMQNVHFDKSFGILND